MSAPVPGPLYGDVIAAEWIGLDWSEWVPINAELGEPGVGLYRLRRHGADDLLYVGQGSIGTRLRAHRAKSRVAGHRQANLFAEDVEVSWVSLNVPARMLLELQNDAIAGHRMNTASAPRGQFIG